MSIFKHRRFPVTIILLCVRWYCKYGISYRDLAEMMEERGVAVDPSTIFRWVQRYAPEIEKRIRLYQGPRSGSWRVDEAYVRGFCCSFEGLLAWAMTCGQCEGVGGEAE